MVTYLLETLDLEKLACKLATGAEVGLAAPGAEDGAEADFTVRGTAGGFRVSQGGLHVGSFADLLVALHAGRAAERVSREKLYRQLKDLLGDRHHAFVQFAGCEPIVVMPVSVAAAIVLRLED